MTRILILLSLLFIVSCSKKEKEKGLDVYGQWDLVAIKGQNEGTGESQGTPIHKPGVTAFVFQKSGNITILENGIGRQDLNGTIKFDIDQKQMIWIHKGHNHGPIRKKLVLEKERLFYENPEGFLMYFKRPISRSQ